MMGCSLYHGKMRFGLHLASKWQIEPFDYAMERHAFGHAHDRFHIRNTLGKGAVAMGAVFVAVKPGGNDGLPKHLISHGCEPVLYIFINLKIPHVHSILKARGEAQIYGATS